MSAGFEGRGEVVRRRVSLLVGAAVFVGIGLAMMLFGAPLWAVFIELCLALALYVAFAADGYRARRAGVIRADASGVYLDGRLLAARRNVESAYVLGTGEPTVQVVPRRADRFDLRFDSEQAAHAVPRALGIDSASSMATFSATYGGRWNTIVGVVAMNVAGNLVVQGAAALLRGRATGLAATFLSMFGAYAVTLWLVRVHVDVGGDGILLRRPGQRRFIPYRSLIGATAAGFYVVLSVRDGKDIRLGMGTSLRQAQSRDALVQRIEERLAAYEAMGDDTRATALVAPGGRPLAVWLKEVRSLSRAHDYREATVDAERLWHVVGDPSADRAARAGAAVALAGAADDQTRARLRIASDDCADPALRTALARVADGADDAQLEEVLAPLAGPDAARNTANR